MEHDREYAVGLKDDYVTNLVALVTDQITIYAIGQYNILKSTTKNPFSCCIRENSTL